MKFEKIFLVFIFCLWIIISFTVGINHEPWSDEAQSWLIARDSSIFELLFGVLKYEGSPILFYLILKIFQFFHFPYQYIFLIPLILTGIGVYLLLFKSRLPFFIKCTFPFTYFIFYQYAVFARNYALIFPILAFIAMLFKDRLKNIYLYSFLLILLASTSAHSFALAFILLVFLIYDIIKNKLINIKNISAISSVALVMLCTGLLLIKPEDCTFSASLQFKPPLYVLLTWLNGFFNLSIFLIIDIIQTILIVMLYIMAFKVFCKNFYQFLFAISINFIIIFVLASVYANYWHYGCIILTLIFTLWILNEENYEIIKNNFSKYLFMACFLLIAFIQIYWSFVCTLFDVYNKYSCSYDAYNFIIDNNLDKQDIMGIGFKTVSIQPYFKNNKYKNFDKSYWVWKKSAEEKVYEDILPLAPVFVMDDYHKKSYSAIINILSKNNYKEFKFKGYLYAKGLLMESNCLNIFVRKDLIK